MAKQMATRTQAKGRVLLGTIVIQHMKSLVWWVADQMKCGLILAAANFTTDVMTQAATEKVLRKELANREPSITGLGKFNPDAFDAHEDAFLNLLRQTYGVLKEPLHYIVCPDAVPNEFANTQEECMFQLPLTMDAYQLDNHNNYRIFLSTPLDGDGLNPMTQPKMVMLPLKKEWAIIRRGQTQQAYHNHED